MKKGWHWLVCGGLLMIGFAGVGYGDVLSIYDVQYTTDPSGDSPYNGQIHDITGGIVTHIWHGFNKRVYLQNPYDPTWGAIVIKDGEGGELADNVHVGDWLSVDDIYIDESRGTTFLQYRRSLAPDVSFSIDSTGNAVPDPVILTAADLPVPVDHMRSEPYESMIVTLESITIGNLDLGHIPDNYEILEGSDIAWGTDYMNTDAGGPYHPSILGAGPGDVFQSITGIVEQYTWSGWDHYQLNTRSTADIVPEPLTVSLLITGMLAVARRRLR